MPDVNFEWPRYRTDRPYLWNYRHPPQAWPEVQLPPVPGSWEWCGQPIDCPLGVAAGPLLNGSWCRYYAALGFAVVTYKTVRSRRRACYPLPNLAPVDDAPLDGREQQLEVRGQMGGSWAVSFGMPSQEPAVWQADLRETRSQLPAATRLNVSVVGSVAAADRLDDLAEDYARCAALAIQAGADSVEMNFSCPNVCSPDGQLFQHPADAAAVARRVRSSVGDAPLLAKIGFLGDGADPLPLLEALAPWVQALAMTNSVPARVRDADGKWLFDGEPRGICGRATLEASLRQVQLARDRIEQRRLDLDLIGVGGVFTFDDVRCYLDAGAASVQLATAVMVDPLVGLKIRRAWRS